MLEQQGTVGCDLDLARRANQQFRVERRLEALHAPGDRGLAHVQVLGGKAEAFELGYGDERLELEQIDAERRVRLGVGCGSPSGGHGRRAYVLR